MKSPTSAAAAFVLSALILGRAAVAQQATPSSPELQQQLQRLAVAAQSLAHSLPSISCVESGSSEALKKGKVKRHVDFTANLRAIRVPGAGLHESFTLTQIDGKPYSKPGYRFPFFAGEGFDAALVYFLPGEQACYTFTLSAGRIDFETVAGAASHPPCRDTGLHGFALVDTNGDVTHVERTVSEQATRDFHLAPFAAVDFAPVELSDRTYRLARHVVSEIHNGDVTRRFEATYSGCKLYTASVTILPPTQVVPDDAAPPR
jgi:hypothetical protein